MTSRIYHGILDVFAVLWGQRVKSRVKFCVAVQFRAGLLPAAADEPMDVIKTNITSSEQSQASCFPRRFAAASFTPRGLGAGLPAAQASSRDRWLLGDTGSLVLLQRGQGWLCSAVRGHRHPQPISAPILGVRGDRGAGGSPAAAPSWQLLKGSGWPGVPGPELPLLLAGLSPACCFLL